MKKCFAFIFEYMYYICIVLIVHNYTWTSKLTLVFKYYNSRSTPFGAVIGLAGRGVGWRVTGLALKVRRRGEGWQRGWERDCSRSAAAAAW